MMGHNVAFHSSGNAVQVKWPQPFNDITAFIDVVKEAMNAKHRTAEPATVASPPAASTLDVIELLKQLGGLKDAGIITTHEFEAKKAELLPRL